MCGRGSASTWTLRYTLVTAPFLVLSSGLGFGYLGVSGSRLEDFFLLVVSRVYHFRLDPP